MATIRQLRRDQPRNKLVLYVCDACEDLLRKKAGKTPLTRAEIQKAYRERQKQKAKPK